MEEIILCNKDIKCTSGTDLSFGTASFDVTTVTTPFTPILYVNINKKI